MWQHKAADPAAPKISSACIAARQLAYRAAITADPAIRCSAPTSLGTVCAADAVLDPKVETATIFPEKTHPPIIFPVALTSVRCNPAAGKFLALIASPAARPALSLDQIEFFDASF
jgi:molybdate transport system substrate-binding protein